MIRKPQVVLLSGVAGVAVVFALGLYLGRRNQPVVPVIDRPKPAPPVPAQVQREQIANVARSHPKLAEQQYRAFVASYAKDANPRVQEEVGKARIGIAYIQAFQKDFKDARLTLLETAANYKGTGAMDPDFGGVKDEAAYQAAVCLVAEKKDDEARSGFVSFLKNYPESPLAKAAYRRLVRLNGGKDLPQYERLVQKDVSAQEKKTRFEIATCGPRALAYLLPLLGKFRPKAQGEQRSDQANQPYSYEELARLCGTTDKGTSLEGMRDALKHFGIESFGYELNLDDFKRISAPAILLNRGHFVVLTKITPDWIQIYDPIGQDGSPRTLHLPEQDDGTFQATVLALKPVPVTGEGDAEPAPGTSSFGLSGAEKNKKETAKKAAQLAQQKKAAEKEWKRVQAEK